MAGAGLELVDLADWMRDFYSSDWRAMRACTFFWDSVSSLGVDCILCA